MNDPKRLREEMDSDLARVLLRAGSWSPWPNSRRNRVLAALGVGLVLTSTKQTAFAALATWQKVALVGCIACAGAGGIVAVQSDWVQVDANETHEPRVQNVAVPEQREAVDTPPTPVADEPTGDLRESTANEKGVQRVTSRADSAATPSRRTSASAAPKSDVRQELAMLEGARKAVRDGDGAGALSALQAYSKRFPKGSLGFEAEVLRIEALAAEGRTAEASRRAERILKRNPRSVVATRLERYVTQ